jgi:hypothetical protein
VCPMPAQGLRMICMMYIQLIAGQRGDCVVLSEREGRGLRLLHSNLPGRRFSASFFLFYSHAMQPLRVSLPSPLLPAVDTCTVVLGIAFALHDHLPPLPTMCLNSLSLSLSGVGSTPLAIMFMCT